MCMPETVCTSIRIYPIVNIFTGNFSYCFCGSGFFSMNGWLCTVLLMKICWALLHFPFFVFWRFASDTVKNCWLLNGDETGSWKTTVPIDATPHGCARMQVDLTFLNHCNRFYGGFHMWAVRKLNFYLWAQK